MQRLRVELNCPPQLPLFPPGALIALSLIEARPDGWPIRRPVRRDSSRTATRFHGDRANPLRLRPHPVAADRRAFNAYCALAGRALPAHRLRLSSGPRDETRPLARPAQTAVRAHRVRAPLPNAATWSRAGDPPAAQPAGTWRAVARRSTAPATGSRLGRTDPLRAPPHAQAFAACGPPPAARSQAARPGPNRKGSPRTSKSARSPMFITSPSDTQVVNRLDPP